jgi:hypothetical protein
MQVTTSQRLPNLWQAMKIAEAFRDEAVRLELVSRERSLAHRYACNGWNAVNYALGTPATVLAVVAGATALLGHHQILTGTAALVGGALAALGTLLNPTQQAHLHQVAAAKYGALQGELRRFWRIDLLLEDQPSARREELETTISEFNKVDATDPPLPFWARWRASREVKKAGSQAPSAEHRRATTKECDEGTYLSSDMSGAGATKEQDEARGTTTGEPAAVARGKIPPKPGAKNTKVETPQPPEGTTETDRPDRSSRAGAN